MKIKKNTNWLFVTQYYHPEPGAAQIRLRAIIKEMTKLGYKINVLTGMPNYPEGIIQQPYKNKFTFEETIDDIPVKRLWLYPAGGKKIVKRILNYLSFTFHAICHLRTARNADIIFIEAQPITLAFFGLFAKFIYKIPYIYNTPDLQVESAGERGWVGNGLVKAATKLESYLMKNSYSVSTVTHAFIDHFMKERNLTRDKFSFLPNGVDLDMLFPIPYNLDFAKKMGVAGKLVFTYAGTHADYQGLDTILDAAKLITRSDIVILMVGKGPVRERLIERKKSESIDNIIFGSSPFNETTLLMSITYSSLVVLRDNPTSLKMRLSKTFPPLACGVPVIFAGYGESADIIEKFECGIKTAPENAESLANAILFLADNPNKRELFSKAGRRLAEKDFSWTEITKNWLYELNKNSNN